MLLRDLIRVFNEDVVKNLTGDVFGRIYEYFLMKFSMSGAGAQEGGEFFTPPSLVQLIAFAGDRLSAGGGCAEQPGSGQTSDGHQPEET